MQKHKSYDKENQPIHGFRFQINLRTSEKQGSLDYFLNTLFAEEPGFERITDVTYLDKELPKSPESQRGVIYDIKCVTSSGKHFIVEMQNAHQSYFVNRSIYYASRSIVAQAKSGKDWNFELAPVYVVAFLNFHMNALGPNVRTDVALCDLDTNKPVSDKIRFIYIQLPLFVKEEDECDNIFDYWLYNIKNMDTRNSIAFTQQHNIFKRLEAVTNYANLDDAQRHAYDEDLKVYRDFQNCMITSHEEGRALGRTEGMEQGLKKGITQGQKNIVMTLINKGMTVQQISEMLDMPIEQVQEYSRL